MVLSALDSNVIGKYHLIAQLGQGGMATVHLAVARGLPGFQKLIVVKVLRPDAAQDNQELCQMFLAEARLSARMQHPNVVQTLEAGDADGRVYLVMEYLDGQPLNLLVRRAKQKPGLWSQAVHVRILAEALRGLHYAHELRDFDGTPLGVVHRDISPHNIFVTYDGQIKLVDFGIAKLAGADNHTQTGVLKGKIAYMAPEQIEGKALDRRADVFAAGVMLFEALTGERMWNGDPDATIFRKVLMHQIPDVHKAAPRAPRRLRDACAKALAIDPADRFRTAAELQRELENWLETSGTRTSTRQVGRATLVLFERERHEVRTIVERQLKALGQSSEATAPPPSLQKPLVGTGSVQLSHLARLSVANSGHPPATPPPVAAATGDMATKAALATAGSPARSGRPGFGRPRANSNSPGSTSAVSLLPEVMSDLAAKEAIRPGRLARSSAKIAVWGTTALVLVLFTLMRMYGAAPVRSTATESPSAASDPGLVALAVSASAPEPVRSVTLTLRAVPSSAVWSVDGVALPKNPYSLTVPRSSTPKRLKLEAPGHLPFERDVVPDRDINFDTVLEVRPRKHKLVGSELPSDSGEGESPRADSPKADSPKTDSTRVASQRVPPKEGSSAAPPSEPVQPPVPAGSAPTRRASREVDAMETFGF